MIEQQTPKLSLSGQLLHWANTGHPRAQELRDAAIDLTNAGDIFKHAVRRDDDHAEEIAAHLVTAWRHARKLFNEVVNER